MPGLQIMTKTHATPIKKNINTKKVFCEKVENFFKLIDKKKIILPKFDCFAYGFPCNDFSNVGESLGITRKIWSSIFLWS